MSSTIKQHANDSGIFASGKPTVLLDATLIVPSSPVDR